MCNEPTHVHVRTDKKQRQKVRFVLAQNVHRHSLDCMTGALWDSCSVHRSHPSSRSIRRLNSPNCSCIPSFLQCRGSTCFSRGTVETWRRSKTLEWKADILRLLQLRRPREKWCGRMKIKYCLQNILWWHFKKFVGRERWRKMFFISEKTAVIGCCWRARLKMEAQWWMELETLSLTKASILDSRMKWHKSHSEEAATSSGPLANHRPLHAPLLFQTWIPASTNVYKF